MGTDQDWEKWGKSDPYFGVYSHAKYRANNLTKESLREFFASGEEYVEALFSRIEGLFPENTKPKHALDFGCGVGRLTKPLAKRCFKVTGLDISKSMITEAQKNCSEDKNVSFYLYSSSIRQEFDFVHTHLVLQHIHPRNGYTIIVDLLNAVTKNGLVVLHFPYKCNASRLIRFLVKLRYFFPILNVARNLIANRGAKEPPMQMHVYDLNYVVALMRRQGFSLVHQELESWDNIFEFTTVYARKGEL